MPTTLDTLFLFLPTLIGCVVCMILAMFRWRFNLIALISPSSIHLCRLCFGSLGRALGQTALQPDYFAYPIYPVMFFGLAGHCGGLATVRGSKPGHDRLLRIRRVDYCDSSVRPLHEFDFATSDRSSCAADSRCLGFGCCWAICHQ